MIPVSFNDDWFVRTEGRSDAAAVGPVTLPHDAMLFEKRDPSTANSQNTGFFPGGVYRYTKTFQAPEEWRERSAVVEFEAVYHRSEVFVNGQLAGGRNSGYALFHVVLDDYLEYGVENTIEVVAHNADGPNSRWYSGSGIYRPVRLLVGEKLRVAPLGLRISTAAVTGVDAAVTVETTVVNDLSTVQRVTVRTALTGPDRSAVPAVESELVVPAAGIATLRQGVLVAQAALWSPDSPQLYQAEVQILVAGSVTDTTRESFGIRTLTADAARGLQINGVTYKLRGSCIHHDNGVIGAHTLDAAEDRRIRLLKESGFNAIRSAHNPVSRATLRACDTYGVLVMDELTDSWFQPKTKNDSAREFAEEWERDLKSMIMKDLNHPSVIMYSIGNEIADTALSRGIAQNRRMAEAARRFDPTRLVTNGINGFLNLIAREPKPAKKKNAGDADDPAFNENLIGVLNFAMGALDKVLPTLVKLPAVDTSTRDAFGALDVAGYNYAPQRYERDGRLHPHRVIVGSETSPTAMAKDWRVIERLPHVIGDFVWTGWDYIGEAGLAVRQYNAPRRLFQPFPALLAGEPLIDITGHRQTQSYLAEIVWHRATGPHIAVEPVNHSGEKQTSTSWRATNSISSWTWDGCEGRTATVEVYADAARVELRLNGRLIDSKPSGVEHAYTSVFTLPYQPGELTATAFRSDGSIVGTTSLRTAGSELRLTVRPETTRLEADGMDLAYLPIELTDSDGIVKPLADRSVRVLVDGPAILLGLGSAEPITDEGFVGTSHRTFYGRALAVLRATHESGEVTVTVSADGCEPVVLTLAAESAKPAVAAPAAVR